MAFDGKQIKSATVTGAKLVNLTVTSGKIADDAIISSKILDAAVTASKLAANAVTAASIADGTITLVKLASNSVDSSKIVDGSITGTDIGSATITGSNIAASTITAGNLATDAVTNAKIQDGAVTLAKLASNSVDSSKIVDGSITGTDIASNTVAAANLVTTYEAGLLYRDGSRAMSGSLDLGTANKITNLADPTQAQDAATKAYVDAVSSALDLKASVRVATTANIALDNTTTAVDGVTLANNDRALVKNQTTASENGLYKVNTSGAWVRTTDADANAEVSAGLFTFVEEGTVNGNTGWVLTTDNPIVVGTTSLAFTQFSGAGSYLNGFGLLLTGNSFSVDFENTDGAILAVANTQDAGVSNKVARADHSHALADGAVTTSKLATGAVTSNEIADGSIKLVDIDQVDVFTPFANFVEATYLRLNGANGPMQGDLDMDSHVIFNLPAADWNGAPTTEAISMFSVAERLDYLAAKEPVLLATSDTDVDIALDGSVTDVDGVTIADLNNGGLVRILVKNQDTNPELNGIYNAPPSGAWTRSNDFKDNVNHEVRNGVYVPVIQGITNSQTIWMLTDNSNDPNPLPNIGTDEIYFSKLSVAADITYGNTGDIQLVGNANDAGSVAKSARADHVHGHGDHSDPNNHAAAIADGATDNNTADGLGANGFMTSAHALKVTASPFGYEGKAANDIDLNTHKIVNLTDPTSNQDAATKAYVDSTAGSAASGDVTNKNMVAEVTTADGQEACATGLAHNPKGYVQVFVNGIKAHVKGDKTGDCYFSANAGVTAKALGSAVATDKLYWNGSVAEYELAVTDVIDFDYIY